MRDASSRRIYRVSEPTAEQVGDLCLPYIHASVCKVKASPELKNTSKRYRKHPPNEPITY